MSSMRSPGKSLRCDGLEIRAAPFHPETSTSGPVIALDV